MSQVIVPPVAWAGRIADFDHRIFGRDSWPETVWADELAADDRKYIAVTGDIDPLRSLAPIEAIAGMRFAEDSELLTVAVAKHRRRQGIARRLLVNLLCEAQNRGACRVFLEVRAGDAGAQALYADLGFESIARRRHYYSDDDALVMCCVLANSHLNP